MLCYPYTVHNHPAIQTDDYNQPAVPITYETNMLSGYQTVSLN
jgi:hypothetical protein